MSPWPQRALKLGAAALLVTAWSGLEASGRTDREWLAGLRVDDEATAMPSVLIRLDPVAGPLVRRSDLRAADQALFQQGDTLIRDGVAYVRLAGWTGGRFALDEDARVLTLHPFRVPPAPVPAARPEKPAPSDVQATGSDRLPEPSAGPAGDPTEVVEPVAAVGTLRPGPVAGREVVTSPLVDATGVRRRDPIDLPLLPDDEWQEWLVAVTLNGRPVSQGSLVLRAQDGRLAVRQQDLASWKVRIGDPDIVAFNDEAFVVLDALGASDVVFDPATQTLSANLPADRLDPNRIDPEAVITPPPQAGWGAFLDYDLQYLAGQGVRERLDGLLETGAFSPHGVLLNSLRAQDALGDDADLVRLETTFQRDLPGSRASFRLGDSLAPGGALGRPARFGGVQYATNFRTDPGFVTFPRPTIGGLADQDSVVDVFIDNARRISTDVPAGPFELDNLPGVTGAGEVQLRVTDLLGREQIVTQSYYVSPRLLQAGLSEYSYELGVLREDYGTRSFAYDEVFGAGTHRYGITNALTAEVHGEILTDLQLGGLGASVLLGKFGLLSGGLAASHADGQGGAQGSLDYEYRGSSFNVGLRTTLTSPDFAQVGGRDDGQPERVDQVSFGFGLGDFGRVGLFFINSEERAFEDSQSFAANYSVRLGPGTLLLNGVQTIAPVSDLAVAAVYSLPLDGWRSLDSTVSNSSAGTRGQVQFRQNRGNTDLGLDYRLAAEAGEDPRLFDGSVGYNTSVAAFGVDGTVQDGDAAIRTNASGSIGLLNGRIGAARRIGRSFGVVDLPGFAGVPVYVDNREVGLTNGAGYLIVPDLRPYETNAIRIDPEALPMNAELATDEVMAVPFERSGVPISFGVRDTRHATAILRDTGGLPLPAGLMLADPAGTFAATVARDGLAYVTGAGGQEAIELSSDQGHVCVLPALPPGETMTDLGEVTCR
ncbi:fimbria/pilus outer membrane usher protein [Marinivivus vitaminiproducens]|uniref:fimbria/pilus outer membrane usher protein n=1 Tax=Marinivivus vitaminiproducens TaxID=3035935 RepID=UPI0027A511CE|nr:fimbria/pilus outer membrane usher protein [Geminicoccaceae bacterium SCSIO 64248]